jgi:hypothetical protein
MDRRIQSHVDRHGERLALRLRFLTKSVDMPSRGEENRELVTSLHAEAMDGDVDVVAVLGIAAEHETHAEVGAGVLWSICRRRQQLTKIEARLVCLMDDLLAQGCLRADGNGRRDHQSRLAHLDAKFPHRRPQEMTHAFAARQQPDENARARVALDVVERHRRPDAGRPHDRATRANVAVHSGKLGLGINLVVRLGILTWDRLQVLDRGPEVVDRRTLPAERMRMARFEHRPRLVFPAHDADPSVALTIGSAPRIP